jgi:tagatose-6-phosphate ketose/aldose isomerase
MRTRYLGLDNGTLSAKGATHLAREICQQPDLWKEVCQWVDREKGALEEFLQRATVRGGRIILTGAGTSAFIGKSLAVVFRRGLGLPVEAVSTTDLVSHPRDHLYDDVPLLMVSFARSGNSPESLAAVSLADELCKRGCHHLIITCNAQGELAKNGRANTRNSYVFALPERAHDQSLAMTSSYTGMMVAGILVARLSNFEADKEMIDIISSYARKAIDYYYDDLRTIAEKDFRRAVFLGSGPLLGTATEAHLKLQELTDGRVICTPDSFLGFRHGPKAVVDETTLMVYLFSNQNYVLKYEMDLVRSMNKGRTPLLEIGLMESRIDGLDLHYSFPFSENGPNVSEEFLAVCSVVPAQILAFFKSLQLGLRPDTPSQTGAISRVVEGVQIYSLQD